MSSALHQSEESSQASITLQLGKLLRRVYSSRHEILEYNLATKSLSVWPWPLNTDTGRRMDLECLRKHVLSPGGSSPRCLCSLKRIDAGFGFQPSTITRAGYFNFTCATNECGYDVPLERIYRSESFMISSFPPQAQDVGHPFRSLIGGHANRRPLKRTYAVFNLSEAHQTPGSSTGFAIRRSAPPIHHNTTDTDLLLRLNSWVQPGLYEQEFRDLMDRMRQCRCGMIMVRNVFDEHRCEHSMLLSRKRARIE